MPAPNNSTIARRDNEYARQRLRENDAAIRERERVRAQVEADRVERRNREAERQTVRRAQQQKDQNQILLDTNSEQLAHDLEGRTARAGCALQFRLLDGSIVKQRFDASDTLRGKVRAWLDAHRLDGNAPYKLKLILSPQPSRSISDEDEQHELKDLGLVPSATLVLVLAPDLHPTYHAAHDSARSIFTRGPCMIFDYAIAILLWALGPVRRILALDWNSGTPHNNRQEAKVADGGDSVSNSSNAPSSSTGASVAPDTVQGIRFRTLSDRRERADDQQFYNGNQVCRSRFTWLDDRV